MRSTHMFLLALSVGCAGDHVTADEAIAALDEMNRSSRGEDATSSVIEVSTDQTIGDRLEDAADTLAAFWEAQAPCTTVTIDGANLTIDYGGLDDPCTYNGSTYAGVTTIGVVGIDADTLDVEHRWDAFANADLRVDGEATVSWDIASQTRAVVTTHTWTDLGSSDTMDVEGDHVFGYLEPALGLAGGFTLEGTRDWDSARGHYELDMKGVEVRLQDPCPQEGVFTLLLPSGKTLEMTNTRIDDQTIEARVTGLKKELVFHINPLGIPIPVDE